MQEKARQAEEGVLHYESDDGMPSSNPLIRRGGGDVEGPTGLERQGKMGDGAQSGHPPNAKTGRYCGKECRICRLM
jgi:hypothetical protein